MSQNAKLYTVEHSMCLEDQKEVHEICWRIPMFKQLVKTKTMTRKYHTHTQTVVNVPESKFKLKMRFFNIGSDDESIEVYYLSHRSAFINIEMIIKLKSFHLSFTDPLQIVESNKWQFCKAFKTPYYYGNSADSLLLRFTLRVQYDCLNIPTTQISHDFGNLLTSGRYSDVIMLSDDGVEFKVHKNVITIRSNVLKAYFEHNMEENLTNVVKTAWNAEVLQDVLSFLYTDNAPRVDNNPAMLLAAAEYYELPGLKKLCEKSILKNLTIDNVFETLQLAELHSANYLKESTLEFIKDGRTKLIIESQGWVEASAGFVKMIYQYIVADEKDNCDILAAALAEVE